MKLEVRVLPMMAFATNLCPSVASCTALTPLENSKASQGLHLLFPASSKKETWQKTFYLFFYLDTSVSILGYVSSQINRMHGLKTQPYAEETGG